MGSQFVEQVFRAAVMRSRRWKLLWIAVIPVTYRYRETPEWGNFGAIG
jgi:hypothetical protein